MYKILFVANNPTALAGMLFLIQKMQEEYGITPILLCENCYYESEKYEVINLTPNYKRADIKKSIKNYYNQKNKSIFYQGSSFVNALRRMRRDDVRTKNWLAQYEPAAVIIYCDRMVGNVQGFIKNAKGIPVIQIPIAINGTKDETFEGRRYNCELIVSEKLGDINKIAEKINKNWVHSVGSEKRLFYPLGYSLAGYFLKMVSMNPWVSGAGGSTHVLVDSRNKAQEILEHVCKNVVVTGLVEDYYILQDISRGEGKKQFLKGKYELKKEKVVIFSMPQMPEHGLTTWDIHKHNMKILIEVLEQRYEEILISLHPKSKLEDYQYLTALGNVKFVEERLRDIISGCDVLIAVSTSTVNRFAELLKIHNVKIEINWLFEKINEKTRNQICGILMEEPQKTGSSIDASEVKKVSQEIMNIIDLNEE